MRCWYFIEYLCCCTLKYMSVG